MQPLQFLERHFGSYSVTKHEALFRCPFCSHHKRKLSVNTNLWCWKCWVCDAKGRSLFSLVWSHNDPHVTRAFRAAFPHDKISVTEDEPDDSFVLELPEEYMPLCGADASNFGVRRAIKYLKSRGITFDQILRHKIGFADSGDFRNRLILPSFDADGRVNFYTGRTVVNDRFKYRNPDVPPQYKRTVVFNELNLDWNRPVVIVEGFFDMLHAPANTLPLFGSTLPRNSKLLLNLVLNNTEVYVCLDQDARDKQAKLIKQLNSYGIICYDIDVSPYQDVAEMPHAVLLEKQSHAQRMNRTSLLRRRIQDS